MIFSNLIMVLRGKRYSLCYLCTILIFVAISLLGVLNIAKPTVWKKHTEISLNNTVNSTILILYWTNVFDSPINVTDKPFEWPFLSLGAKNNKFCPVKCELSSNKSRLMEASALVMHGGNIKELPLSSKYAKSLPWILHINENPAYWKSLGDEGIMGKFSYLASYRLDADFPCPQFTRPDLMEPIPFAEKKGLAVAIYSNCEDTRTLYMFRLMKHMAVDSYGKCLRNRPRLPSGYNLTKAVMRRYKFVLTFPNADCDYYMTEKMYNVLSAGSVPVWMGTDKIDEVLQWGNLRHSYIKVGDFPSPKKLAEYLLDLAGNERKYNHFLKWKYEGLKFPKEYYKSAIGQWWDGLPLYCRVCMRIAKDLSAHTGLPADRCDGKQRRTLEKWIRE